MLKSGTSNNVIISNVTGKETNNSNRIKGIKKGQVKATFIN